MSISFNCEFTGLSTLSRPCLIINSALTAEHLEATFYRQGFAKFPASDFQALGLSDANIQALLAVGQTEATHVSTLLSAIAGAGFEPVAECQ